MSLTIWVVNNIEVTHIHRFSDILTEIQSAIMYYHYKKATLSEYFFNKAFFVLL